MLHLVAFYFLVLVLSVIPSGFAGPACARQQCRTTDCGKRCKVKWNSAGNITEIRGSFVTSSPSATTHLSSSSASSSVTISSSTSSFVITSILASSSPNVPKLVTTESPVMSKATTSYPDVQAYLSAHNNLRAKYGASPLVWNSELANKAQQWVNGCEFHHSGGSLGPYGENLAAGTGQAYGILQAIKSWADESSDYDANNPQSSHFTQMVWKGSHELGCAVQECSGIFPARFGMAKYYACEYFPAGNVIGYFAANVQD